MPTNGYWIECVPVIGNTGESESIGLAGNGLYAARLATIPDVQVIASSPDQAIDRLRHKLRALGRYYRIKGQKLPDKDNPVQPPHQAETGRGLIAIYVQVGDICNI